MKTFGEMRWHESRRWLVQAEPHVLLRAKRVFAGVSNQHRGYLVLADTLNNSRDLYWFLERYPMLMTDEDWKRLEQRATAHQERESLVDRLLRGKGSRRKFKLAIPAREYQQVAADLWLKTGQLLLADEVGLGKTASTICGLTDPRTRPALVVTLTSLARQWQREIRRFAPQLTTHIVKKTEPYDVSDGTGQIPDVLITTYSKLAGWSDTLPSLVKSVVYDEVQELRGGEGTERNPIAKGVAAARISRAVDFRIACSGTPIYNYGNEMFNVMEMVAPGELGTREEFQVEHCTGKSLKEAEAFGLYLRQCGLMLRRTRADVGRELPDLSRIVHTVDMDQAPLKEAEGHAERLAAIILSNSAQKRGEVFRASEELSALVRQATGLGKAPYVAEFVRLLLESGEPVVLTGWHRSVYDVWLERLKDFKPAMYTGTESPAQKDEARRRFTGLRPDGTKGPRETNLLILSLRSGVGLDGLQFACRTVVFGELDWSPGVAEQVIGRVHRDGQPDPVVVYYLLSDGGSDPIVADVLGIKREQIEGIRNPGTDHLEKLETNPERIKELARRFLASRGKTG